MEPADATFSAAPDPRRWLMFGIMICGNFLTPLDYFIVNVALPSIKQALGASPATLQAVIASYAATYAVLLITGGRLGDLFGRVRMFSIGLVGFGAASAVCGLAPTPGWLVAGRILQGIAAAILAPQCLATVNTIFPREERPRVLSIYGAVFGFGAVVGQSLGGLLVHLNVLGLGWRIIFLVNLPVIALLLAFGLPLLRETRGTARPKIDYVGVVLLSLTLFFLIVPLLEGRENGWPFWAIGMLILVPPAGALFVRHERREVALGRMPLVDLAAFSSRGTRFGMGATLFFYSNSALLLLISVYLQNGLGLSALEVGTACLPFGIGFLVGPFTTPSAGRIFHHRLIAIGLGIEVVATLLLVHTVSGPMVSSVPRYGLISASLFLHGFGQGVSMPVLVREVTGRFHSRFAGLASGVVSSCLQISSALSIALIGGVFFTVLGSGVTAREITHAFAVAMMCVAVGLSVAALLSVFMEQGVKRSL